MLTEQQLQAIEGRILYEDNHFLAINKRCGELVQGDSTGDEPLVELLRRFIAQRDGKPGAAYLQVAHRIDRPVGGCVLFAKTSKGIARINTLFREQAIKRQYWAVATAPLPLPEGELKGNATRNPKQNKTYIQKNATQKTKAIALTYRAVGASNRYFLYEVQLQTGWHHQIRALFSAAGAPIRGDLKYGAPRSLPNGGIDLHARSLDFSHPVTHEPIHIVAPAPEGPIWALFAKQ